MISLSAANIRIELDHQNSRKCPSMSGELPVIPTLGRQREGMLRSSRFTRLTSQWVTGPIERFYLNEKGGVIKEASHINLGPLQACACTHTHMNMHIHMHVPHTQIYMKKKNYVLQYWRPPNECNERLAWFIGTWFVEQKWGYLFLQWLTITVGVSKQQEIG